MSRDKLYDLLFQFARSEEDMVDFLGLVPMKYLRRLIGLDLAEEQYNGTMGELIGIGVMEWIKRKCPEFEILEDEPGLRVELGGKRLQYGPLGTSFTI